MSDGLDAFLQHISSQVHAAAGVEVGAEVAENAFASAETLTLAKAKHFVNVPIQNGRGELTSEKKTTAWVTIEGTATVTTPTNGTWNIRATDLVANKTVFEASGLPCNQPKWFSYQTGWSTQLKVVAEWSEPANTTLKVTLDTNH